MHKSSVASCAVVSLSACLFMLAGCTPSGQESAPATVEPPAAEPPAQVEDTSAAVVPPPVAQAGIDAIVPLAEAERDEVLNPSFTCNLSAIDGVVFAGEDLSLADPGDVVATGWLIPEGGPTAESVALRIESADKSQVWEVPVSLDIPREDLPNASGTNGGGFSRNFDASALQPGRYHLYLAYRTAGRLMGCDNGRFVVIP